MTDEIKWKAGELTEAERHRLAHLVSDIEEVIRVEESLVDKNALTMIPGIDCSVNNYWTTLHTELAEMKGRLVVKERRVSKSLKKLSEYITDAKDREECEKMLEFPCESFSSDMSLLVSSRLPPWKTRKGDCDCPKPLPRRVREYSKACQPCLKRTFRKLWIMQYTKKQK